MRKVTSPVLTVSFRYGRLQKRRGTGILDKTPEGEIEMQKCFEEITPQWLGRAYLFNGSIGRPGSDFRYRLSQDEKEKLVRAAVYSKVCYEKADDVETRDFPWDEEGVAALREWLEERYEAFLAKEK